MIHGVEKELLKQNTSLKKSLSVALGRIQKLEKPQKQPQSSKKKGKDVGNIMISNTQGQGAVLAAAVKSEYEHSVNEIGRAHV